MRMLKATTYGYSSDKRKRRRQHRANAKRLRKEIGVFNDNSPSTIIGGVIAWHIKQARSI